MRRWTFGDAVVDERTRELRVRGERADIDRKPLEALLFLLRHAGTVVGKEQLAAGCWPGRILSDSVLDKTLSRVREALGGGTSVIETVRGVGWRLVVPVRSELAGAERAQAAPGNLPTPLSSLVGRDAIVRAAAGLLQRPAVRLMTLTGCGGIGKTRLSLALAERVASDFPDGAYFVDLAPVRASELFVPAIAQVLQVREQGQQPLLGSVTGHLRDKTVLLVLDNLEQLLSAAPLLAEILTQCGRAKIVATSRERLNLRGEHEVEVPALAVPAVGANLDDMRACSAVALFEQCAQMVNPGFLVDAGTMDDVAEICRRLDGLPLAIELAGARSKLFEPAALRARLDRRFDLLRDGFRDLPPRQRALWTTVDWSHELLDPRERCLLRRLSVFAGGFTLEAAQAVGSAGDVAKADVFAILARLVDKSLVSYEDQGLPGRYRLLETIREYAAERLAQSGELDSAHRRHLEHLLGLAHAANAHVDFFMSDTRMAEWMPRVAAEHDNLRAALRWGAARPESAPDALRLAASLHWFWFSAGHITESVALLRELLARATSVPRLLRAQAWVAAANLAVEQGGSDAERTELLGFAHEALERSLATFSAHEDHSWTAYVLSSLAALIVTVGGDPAEAHRHVVDGLALARRSNDRWLVSYLTHFLGRAAWFQRDLGRAAESFTESIQAARDMGGNQIGEAYGTHWLGRIARAQGDLDAARAHQRAALRMFQDAGNLQGLAAALTGLGGIEARAGDPRIAYTLLAVVSHWRSQRRTFLEPDLAEELAQDWACTRAALTPAACEVLSTTAAAMDPAQAAACARGETPV